MSTHTTPEAEDGATVGGSVGSPGGAATRGVSRVGRIRDATITVLGIVGVITVAWLIASWLFGLSLVVFVTGSMAPTMPTGAAAISQITPAADLVVGDVVTVPRPDTGQPVTHRIVGIDTVVTSADARELTLQGDDNDFADSHTYRVEEAPRVLVSAPGIGTVVLWAQTPIVMIIGCILIASAIAWALWPTGARREDVVPDES